MYIRYELDQTASVNTTAHTNMMADLLDAIDGTITDPANFTSDYCNKELSEIHGSVTHGTATTDLYETVYESTGEWRIKKYHNGRDNTNNYEPAGVIGLYWVYGQRPSCDFKTKDDLNWVMSSDTQRGTYWTPDSGPGQAEPHVIDAVNYNRILIFASAYYFILQLYHGDRLMSMGLLDFEDSDADSYSYTLDNNASPQIYFGFDIQDARSGQTSQQALYWGRSHYMSGEGQIYTGSTSYNVDAFLGYATSFTTNYPSMYPQPRLKMPAGKVSGGSGHFLAPTYLLPTTGNGAYSMVNFGKFPYFYRTTDDIAQGGDIISYNSVEYMAVPLHKTDGQTEATGTLMATYLVPKLIGGV